MRQFFWWLLLPARAISAVGVFLLYAAFTRDIKDAKEFSANVLWYRG